MNELRVDREKCTKCGTCLRICPAGIIKFGDDGFPEMSEKHSGRCIQCAQCVLFCSAYADTLSFMDHGKIVRSEDIVMPTAEQAENLLKTRRSIRKFKDERIPRELFARIFETVRQAPTAVNYQPVRWVVSDDPEKTKEITNLILCWFREEIFKNPTDPGALLGAAMIAKAKAGEDALLRGAPHVAVAVVPKEHRWPEDGAIALTYLELAAHGLGIGCCWGGYLTIAIRSFAPLREYLGIGDDEHICGAQMMGWPQLRPLRQYPPRREANIHWL